MAVIGPIARYLLLAVLLVGSPAVFLCSIASAVRRSSNVPTPPVLVGVRHALNVRLAEGDLAPEEFERIHALIRSLPLRTRLRAGVGINSVRLCWILWCAGWALFWALAGIVQLHLVPLALLLAPLSVATAFVPVGRSRTVGQGPAL
jgi:hypothetical protein